MNKKIVTLTGFMGCGKTYISKILARELGYQAIDSDAEIEKRQRKSIPQIIAETGELGFRKLETEVLTDLLNEDFYVLSAGGGAALKNGALLKEKSTVIFLDTDFEKCFCRIKDDKNRPLVRGKTKDEIFDLYSGRYSIYNENCHFAVKNDDATETVRKIKDFLQNN